MYLANHYIALHVTVVSLALGAAGVAAANLVSQARSFVGYENVVWILWAASLLATAVAYAGTMIGALVLPARLPSIIDLLLPLVLGISEFVLFVVFLGQPARPSEARALITAWWFALGAFGLMAAASVGRARHIIKRQGYEAALSSALEPYLASLTRDRMAAFFVGVLGIAAGLIHATSRDVPTALKYLLPSVTVGVLGVALITHDVTARALRAALATALAEPPADEGAEAAVDDSRSVPGQPVPGHDAVPTTGADTEETVA